MKKQNWTIIWGLLSTILALMAIVSFWGMELSTDPITFFLFMSVAMVCGVGAMLVYMLMLL